MDDTDKLAVELRVEPDSTIEVVMRDTPTSIIDSHQISMKIVGAMESLGYGLDELRHGTRLDIRVMHFRKWTT